MIADRISYAEFVRLVRGYATTPLIRALAAMEPGWCDPDADLQGGLPVSPWAVATIAMVSLDKSNDHRGADQVAEADIRFLCAAYNTVHESSADADEHFVLRTLLRPAVAQFPFQESDFEEVARTVALVNAGVDAHGDRVRAAIQVAFGADIATVVNATVVLWGLVRAAHGHWNPNECDRADLADIMALVDRDTLFAMAHRLTASQKEFRSEQAELVFPSRPDGALWKANALVQKPLIELPRGQVVAPLDRLILRRAMTRTIYFDCLNAFGDGFAADLGLVVQDYVGQQLGTIPGATVLAEVEYRRGRDQVRSIDWFMVTDRAVILFEVKSARLMLAAQAGDDDLVAAFERALTKAVVQIDRTVADIRNRTPALAHIPVDRPIVGVIVTAEDLHQGNSPDVRALLPVPTVPTLTMCLRELEHLIPRSGEEIAEELLRVATHPEQRHWAVHTSTGNFVGDFPNPLLEAAADLIPVLAQWREGPEAHSW